MVLWSNYVRYFLCWYFWYYSPYIWWYISHIHEGTFPIYMMVYCPYIYIYIYIKYIHIYIFLEWFINNRSCNLKCILYHGNNEGRKFSQSAELLNILRLGRISLILDLDVSSVISCFTIHVVVISHAEISFAFIVSI